MVLEVGRAMALEGRPRPDAGACERVTSHGKKDFADVIPGSPGGAVILSAESPSPQRSVRVDEGGRHQRGHVSSEAQVGVMWAHVPRKAGGLQNLHRVRTQPLPSLVPLEGAQPWDPLLTSDLESVTQSVCVA